MRIAILLALLPLTASAMEISDVRLIRQFNGQNLQCKETQELGHGSYFATLKAASALDDAALFGFHLKFVLCNGDKNNEHWTPRNPLDDERRFDSDGNPVRVAFRNPELVFRLEGGPADPEVVSVPNAPEQALNFRFPIAANLSAEQARDLAAGKPVPVRAQLLYRAVGTAYTSREEIPLGYQFGAAYTVFFTLKK